jgi:hypothetical protein
MFISVANSYKPPVNVNCTPIGNAAFESPFDVRWIAGVLGGTNMLAGRIEVNIYKLGNLRAVGKRLRDCLVQRGQIQDNIFTADT